MPPPPTLNLHPIILGALLGSIDAVEDKLSELPLPPESRIIFSRVAQASIIVTVGEFLKLLTGAYPALVDGPAELSHYTAVVAAFKRSTGDEAGAAAIEADMAPILASLAAERSSPSAARTDDDLPPPPT